MGVMSVREFNANVSRAIALVETGESIDITRDGRIVAELRPKAYDRRTDPEVLAARDRLMALLAEPFGFGGPATYEERTER